MIALPSAPGTYGTALIVLGLLLGSIGGALAWRRLRRLLVPRSTSPGSVAAFVAVTLASSLGLAPYLAWRVVQDLRFTARAEASIVDRVAASANRVDGDAYDRIAAAMPPDATYYVAVDDPERRINFVYWAHSTLLPRIAVADPRKAGWILTQGIDPRTLGFPLASVRAIPWDRGDEPPVYLARVAS